MKKPSPKPETDLGKLARVGWLSQQPDDFQHRMFRIGRFVTLPKGHMLYDVGDTADAIFGLEDGLLDVALPISQDEMATIHRAAPGFWIGDAALFAETTRTVAISAAAHCRLFRLPADAVRRDLAEFPQDWNCFFKLSQINVMLALSALAEVIALPPRARIARLLLRQAGPDGIVRTSQEDLGHMVGMSRATFRRAFASLVESGVVQPGYGYVQILDRAALESKT